MKRKIAEALAHFPAAQNLNDNSTEIDFEFDFGSGELFITLVPHRKERAATVRGVVSGVDNTEQRIRAVVRRKKK